MMDTPLPKPSAAKENPNHISTTTLRRCFLALFGVTVAAIAIPQMLQSAKRGALVEQWNAGKMEVAACTFADNQTVARFTYQGAKAPNTMAVAAGLASGACTQG